jgi:hypothetical protein
MGQEDGDAAAREQITILPAQPEQPLENAVPAQRTASAASALGPLGQQAVPKPASKRKRRQSATFELQMNLKRDVKKSLLMKQFQVPERCCIDILAASAAGCHLIIVCHAALAGSEQGHARSRSLLLAKDKPITA